jgi:hypothetical protein
VFPIAKINESKDKRYKENGNNCNPDHFGTMEIITKGNLNSGND